MFGMSPWHLAVLVLVGLFVFGPERLPSMIKDLGKALRQVREAANSMQADLKSELGPEVGDLDLRSLHPKTFVSKHLFGDDPDPLGMNSLRDDVTSAVSFDKPDEPVTEYADDHQVPAHEPISAMDAVAEPLTAAELPSFTKSAGTNAIKYDLDAT
jgi:sec-independent protein translocase protein TatB